MFNFQYPKTGDPMDGLGFFPDPVNGFNTDVLGSALSENFNRYAALYHFLYDEKLLSFQNTDDGKILQLWKEYSSVSHSTIK